MSEEQDPFEPMVRATLAEAPVTQDEYRKIAKWLSPREIARAELRDRFAMAALTGLLAEGWTGDLGREKRAASAWQEADAMLKARGDE